MAGIVLQVCSWSKANLSRAEWTVLSIEGTALHARSDGTWELFISSEKEMPYPASLRDYQKPGTGVWTIDRICGPSPGSFLLVIDEHRPCRARARRRCVRGVRLGGSVARRDVGRGGDADHGSHAGASGGTVCRAEAVRRILL